MRMMIRYPKKEVFKKQMMLGSFQKKEKTEDVQKSQEGGSCKEPEVKSMNKGYLYKEEYYNQAIQEYFENEEKQKDSYYIIQSGKKLKC